MNRTLFFGFNTRTDSYFEGGELASSGLPTGKELEILNQYKDKLPPELFTKEFKLPVYDTPQATRENLRRPSTSSSRPAGSTRMARWSRPTPASSSRSRFLGDDPTDERIAGPFITKLRKLGIDAIAARRRQQPVYQPRPQFRLRHRHRACWRNRNRPATSSAISGASKAADTPGSRNFAGIKDPVVDALVDRVIFATDRDELVAATHALDRVLLWNYYVVPQWHLPKVWLAYWNKFGIPGKAAGLCRRRHRIPGGSTRPRRPRCRPNTRAQN